MNVFKDMGYFATGMIAWCAANPHINELEKKLQFLSEKTFNQPLNNDTKKHLEKTKGKRLVAIAVDSSYKTYFLRHLVNMARKACAIGAVALFNHVIPQTTSVISLIPKHQELTALFHKFMPSPIAFVDKSYRMCSRHRIFVLSPLIIHMVSILCGLVARKCSAKTTTKKDESVKNTWKNAEKIANVASQFLDFIGNKLEALLWARIALLVVAANKTSKTEFMEDVQAILRNLVPLDNLTKQAFTHGKQFRAFVSKCFACLSAWIAFVSIQSQRRSRTNLDTLNSQYDTINQLGLGTDLENFIPEKFSEIIESINKAKKDGTLEEEDKKILLDKLFSNLISEFHKTMHEPMLKAELSAINNFEETLDEVEESFNYACPDGWINIKIILTIYKIIIQIKEQSKEGEKFDPLKEIEENDLLKLATDDIYYLTEFLPQFQGFVQKQPASFPQDKQKLRIRYLADQIVDLGSKKNPYAHILTDLGEIQEQFRKRSSNNCDATELEVINKKNRAIIVLTSILIGCKAGTGQDVKELFQLQDNYPHLISTFSKWEEIMRAHPSSKTGKN